LLLSCKHGRLDWMSVKWLRNDGNRLQFWVFTGSVQSL